MGSRTNETVRAARYAAAAGASKVGAHLHARLLRDPVDGGPDAVGAVRNPVDVGGGGVDHRSADPSPIVDRRGWRAVDDVTGSGV